MLQVPASLRLLGSFELRVGGVRVVLPMGVQRVVAYVALQHGSVMRTNIAGTLWPDVPEARAMANLRSALWRLHQPGVAVLDTGGESITIAPRVLVDAHELVSIMRGLLDGRGRSDGPDVDLLTQRRELLGDWDDEWVLVERERLRHLRLQALERLAADLADGGQFGRATEAALAAVTSEPLRESAHRALISVHLAQGNRAEALRQFWAYRRLLRDELALEPSDHMQALVGHMSPIAGDHRLPAGGPD